MYLEEQNLLHILDEPHRIFNCDETAFFLAPKDTAVLASKGRKEVLSIKLNYEKENLTALIIRNAAGDYPPPMVVYDYKRIPFAIASTMPENWGIGKIDSGWMTGESFFEYIANVFYKWLKKNYYEFPIILFVDVHTSHMTLNLSEFCKENKIFLIILLPNSRSILQPLDVAVFRALKLDWYNTVTEWRMKNNGKKIAIL